MYCYPVIWPTNKEYDGDCFVAIGNGKIRQRLSKNRKLVTLIHPSVVVANIPDHVIAYGNPCKAKMK